MKRIKVVDLDYDLETPEFDYYYKQDCPICKKFVRIVDELDFRTNVFVDRIDVSSRTDKKYMWWENFCDKELGNRVVPILVFWDCGFERGEPDIFILEKKYTGVVTKTIEEGIATLSKNLISMFEKYMYVQVRI